MERCHDDKLYAKCCTDEIDEVNPLLCEMIHSRFLCCIIIIIDDVGSNSQ